MKNQLLATGGDEEQKDKALFLSWADECKKCVGNADQHETKMKVLLAKIVNVDSVSKDTEKRKKLEAEVKSANNTMEHMYEGIQLSLKRFKDFLH